MRTVSEIVDAVQEQSPVTDEELRLGLLALFYAIELTCKSDYERASDISLRARAQENFALKFRMLKSKPTEWLGARYTPGTKENKEGRTMSKKLLEAFLRSKKREQNDG